MLYMTEYFGMSDNESYSILGVFTALAYMSPLAGGYLASHVTGFKLPIVWGGLFLVFGYFLLSLPFAEKLLYPALATIIVGTGLFKPNISSILGEQYSLHDPHRDSGFTIFYIGINLGAFLAGVSSGYIKDYFGWQTCFGLASIGLIIGLLVFWYGLRYLKESDRTFAHDHKAKWRLFFYCILAVLALNFLLKLNAVANWLLPCVGALLLVYLTVVTVQQQGVYRNRMFVLNILIISSIVFWMLYFQIFSACNLFVNRLVDKHLFGFPLTTTVFYASVNFFIIILGPLFAWSWHSLGRRSKNPSPILKFVFGIFFAGLGFLVLAASTLFPDASSGMIHPIWVFSAYFLITIGELLLSPIGLSAVTMLAPDKLIGLMMGIWFVSLGFGGLFAGWTAKLASVPETVVSTAGKLLIYQNAFLDYAYIAFFVAIFLYFVQVVLRRFLQH